MKIAIYHTTDIHGYIFPTNYVEYQELGLLKIASFIEKDKKKYDKSLLLDGGDLIQGSAMTNYLSKAKFDVNPILNLTKEVGYDGYVMGNHEFNYGLNYLRQSYKIVENRVLNANILGLDLGNKPYEIFDFNGYKIGVIGLTTAYIPNWEQDKNIEGLKFLDPVEQYAKYENELKAKSDKIIILYHGGFEKSLDEEFIPTEKINGENQASEMLEKFNSIDIVLSGHQHRSFITKIKGVVCSQPINNGKTFTKIVLDTETDDIEYELIDVSDINIKINTKFEKFFEKTNENLDEYLSRIVGKLNKPIKLKDHFKVRFEGSPYINLLQKIQIDASGADFSSTTLFDSAIGFDGEVSIRDILVNYPYPNSLKVLKVTGYDLKKAIEISATYFVIDDNGNVVVNSRYTKPKVRHYIYDFYYGLNYVIDLKRPFLDRVVSMTRNGEELDLDKEYTIVVNNYRASNVNEYPCYEGKEVVKEINFEMSELIINYVMKHKYIEVDETKNFKYLI